MNAQDIVNPVRGARVSYCGICTPHWAFGTPNRKLPLAGNYNGGEAEPSSQWASHFGAARGRKGGAAGWRWGRGLLWGGCDMWARLLKVTGAAKFRVQEGSGKCPAGSPNLSLDQDWISSRPQYGCDPHF